VFQVGHFFERFTVGLRKIINQQGASDSERGVSPSDGSDVSRSKNGGNEVTLRSMGLGESEIFRMQHQMKRNSKI
jgi:hypothetical protein